MPIVTRRHAAGVLAGAVGLLLAPLPPTMLGPWQGKLLDFGHVPLFAVLVVVLRVTFRVALGWPLLVAVVVAALAEVVQPYFGRTRDWADLAGGVLGALAGAAAFRTWQHRRSPRRLVAYALLAVALPAWPTAHVLPYFRDTVAGRRSFPVLADFSTDDQMLRWDVQQATITREAGGARIDLRPGDDPFSYVALRPVNGDFRGYKWLCCKVVVTGGWPLDIHTSVRATAADGRHTSHGQVGGRYVPGEYVVRYDLDSLVAWAAGRGEPLNLADVRWVQFFAWKLPEPRTVVLRKMWLEND